VNRRWNWPNRKKLNLNLKLTNTKLDIDGLIKNGTVDIVKLAEQVFYKYGPLSGKSSKYFLQKYCCQKSSSTRSTCEKLFQFMSAKLVPKSVSPFQNIK